MQRPRAFIISVSAFAVFGACSADNAAVDPITKQQFAKMSDAQAKVLSDGNVSLVELNVVLANERRCLQGAGAEVAPDPDGGFGWQIQFGPNVKDNPSAVVERCGQESRPTVGVYIAQHQPSEAERSRLNEGVATCLDKLGISVAATDSALKKELASQVNRSIRRTGTPEQQASADQALECFGPWQAGTLSPEPGIDPALSDWLKSH